MNRAYFVASYRLKVDKINVLWVLLHHPIEGDICYERSLIDGKFHKRPDGLMLA